MSSWRVVSLCLFSAVSVAQTVSPAGELPPPPMVPSTPPPMPPSDAPGTPPPPSSLAPSSMPYSPYGQPRLNEKPAPEVGLMVSESLFGSLTAAGVTVLPYFLLFANGALTADQSSSGKTLSSVIFILIFSAAPLAVSQTQVGLANGSRYYRSETWIPALVGLAGEAGVLGIFAATGWLQTPLASGGVPNGGSVAWLMIGSIGVVPLLQMAAINVFKEPKFGNLRVAWGNPDKGLGVALSAPSVAPILSPSAQGMGVQLSFLRGRF